MRYDQRRGGWRGPVARLPAGPALRDDLGGPARPDRAPARHAGGMAAGRGAGSDRNRGEDGLLEHGPAAAPLVLPMRLADLGWARPVQAPARAGGRRRRAPPPGASLGPAPRRIGDVVRPATW